MSFNDSGDDQDFTADIDQTSRRARRSRNG
jgi:hypothetical protein